MHFKYNLLIVFEIEEFNFVLYCRNKCILRRPHHYCSSFFLFKNQHIYSIQLNCRRDPTKSSFSWGASKLEGKCSLLYHNVAGANRIVVGLDVYLPPAGKRFPDENESTLFRRVVRDICELNVHVTHCLWMRYGQAKLES